MQSRLMIGKKEDPRPLWPSGQKPTHKHVRKFASANFMLASFMSASFGLFEEQRRGVEYRDQGPTELPTEIWPAVSIYAMLVSA